MNRGRDVQMRAWDLDRPANDNTRPGFFDAMEAPPPDDEPFDLNGFVAIMIINALSWGVLVGLALRLAELRG